MAILIFEKKNLILWCWHKCSSGNYAAVECWVRYPSSGFIFVELVKHDFVHGMKEQDWHGIMFIGFVLRTETIHQLLQLGVPFPNYNSFCTAFLRL